MKQEQEMDDSRLRGADREMYCSWTAGVGGTREPPLPQSSLCHHLDAILKPSAPAPHVNKGTTPNMLSSLNELFLAAAEPQNGWLSGVWAATRMAGWYYKGGHSGLYHSGACVGVLNDITLMFVQNGFTGAEVSAQTHTDWVNKGSLCWDYKGGLKAFIGPRVWVENQFLYYLNIWSIIINVTSQSKDQTWHLINSNQLKNLENESLVNKVDFKLQQIKCLIRQQLQYSFEPIFLQRIGLENVLSLITESL